MSPPHPASPTGAARAAGGAGPDRAAGGAVAERLRGALGAGRVAEGETARSDFAVDGLRPAAVAFPETPEQVAALLALAGSEGWAVIPWGGGSGMARGNVPVRYDVALCLSRLAALLDHDVENLTFTAAAGLSVGEANRRIAPHHQLLAIAHAEAPHTLGGCVAANRIAPRRLLFGEVRDQLLGLRVALPDGTLVRYGRKVLKNVAGYDMNKLFVGSQGMLGVVVETTFKLFALPDQEACLLATFPTLEDAAAAAGALFRSRLLPAFLHVLDATSGAQAHAALLGPLPAGAPASLSGDAAGDAAPAAAHLLVGFAGRAVTVARQLRDTQALLRQHGAGAVQEAPRVTPALREVLERPAPVAGVPAALRLRCGVLPTALAALARRLAQTAGELGVPHAIGCDYGAGQLQLALGALAEDAVPMLVAALTRLRAELSTQRGYALLEQAPAAVKAELAALGAEPDELRLMRVLKRRFDPGQVLAPGRYLSLAD